MWILIGLFVVGPFTLLRGLISGEIPLSELWNIILAVLGL
jgi:hypothetical protein